MKSADWKENKPFRLKERTATELAKLPPYYMMDLNKTMPQTVAEHMPSAAQIAANTWLTEDELRVYSTEFSRTGFQGELQVYRGSSQGSNESLLYAELSAATFRNLARARLQMQAGGETAPER
jgi:hypothetical protein